MRRSGLLARLGLRWRRPPAQRQAQVTAVVDDRLVALEGELARLRVLGIAHAAAAARADLRAQLALEQVEVLRAELGTARAQLVAVREELLWAFAEGRLPVVKDVGAGLVVDLRDVRSA